MVKSLIYRNLTRGGWSVLPCVNGNVRRRGTGPRNALRIVVRAAECIVNERDRQSVCANGHRLVMAWVAGEVVEDAAEIAAALALPGVPVTFHKERPDYFDKRDSSMVSGADYALFEADAQSKRAPHRVTFLGEVRRG